MPDPDTPIDSTDSADTPVAGVGPSVRRDDGVARSRAPWTQTRGRELVAEYIAANHAGTPAGIAHSEVVTHLMLEHDCDPEQATNAIRWAFDDDLIHEPDVPNHYRPTDASHQ